MPGRNLAKPFAIVGLILAEIYMLFVMLGNYGHESQPLPMPPLPEAISAPASTAPPLHAKVTRVLIGSVFFGTFGALVGTGIGLLVSGLLGDFREPQKRPPAAHPESDSPPPQKPA